jgi:3-oxoacyl-[acyl-carrier protein] reductase
VRNVVVTGGTRGLGIAIARKLAADGYRAIAVARQQNDHFAACVQQAEATAPGSLRFAAFDLNDIAFIPKFVASLSEEFGPLHGLVNNAGLGTSGILATLADPQIERLLRLNVTSPITLTKYAVRAMMVGGAGGRIVNISSVVASTGYSGLSVYAASKAALAGFTRSLAREIGPLGITVNCVAPGFVDTDMTGGMKPAQRAQIIRRSALRRLPDAKDVAAAVAFLVSDAAGNVTGTTVTVDAGNTA